MLRLFAILLISSLSAWAQNSSNLPDAPSPQPGASPSANSPTSDSGTSSTEKSDKPVNQPDLSPPRSDTVPAAALEGGSSSSKDTQVDLSDPPDEAKAHPHGAEAVNNVEAADAFRGGDVSEFHVWDPHKAAKDVEVGDFYFRRKNYAAAEDRYREALYYKNNDALATYRLAICLEKMNRPQEAVQQYESYLKILPYGPEAKAAHKSIDRLKPTSDIKPAK